MGLFDIFRRRHRRESALAQIQAEGGSVSFGESPAAGASSPGPATEGNWMDLLKRMAGGQVQVSQAQQSIDLRNVEGLREDVLNALRQHGVDPENPGTVDASSVPGLQDAMMQAFQAHGVDFAALTGMAGQGVTIAGAPAGGTPALGDADAIAAQLKQLDDLRAQGILGDAEYKQQRQKLLDQL